MLFDHRFQGAQSCKCPASAALTLVLDAGYVAFLDPINLCVCRDLFNGKSWLFLDFDMFNLFWHQCQVLGLEFFFSQVCKLVHAHFICSFRVFNYERQSIDSFFWKCGIYKSLRWYCGNFYWINSSKPWNLSLPKLGKYFLQLMALR